MSEAALACEDHANASCVAGFDYIFVFDASTWLDDYFDTSFSRLFDIVYCWEKGIAGKNSSLRFFPCLM
jgi:hypothetical protein